MNRYTSVKDYIAQQPEASKAKLTQLRAIIMECVPEAEEGINYNIAAFALIPGGKRDQQIMMAGFKNHVGFYPGPQTISHFEQELKPFKTSKGAIQLSLKEPLPVDLIKKMVNYRRLQLSPNTIQATQ